VTAGQLRLYYSVDRLRQLRSFAVCSLGLIALLSSHLCAQSPQGAIVGAVTDSTGAAVATAKVVLVNQDTKVSREFQTNTTGQYEAPFLPVATYSVTVEAAGFKRFQYSHVKLSTGQTVRIDAVLQVGDVSSSVTVSGGGVQLIQLEKPTISASMGQLELKELPSNFRYFMNYLVMSPGTSGIMNTVVNGGQRLSVNFVMDGVSIKDMVRGEYTAEVGAGPSVEAMEEVTMKTSTAGTDTGLGTAEVHLITKSGSNQFHGSLFEYYRGNFAEARNKFNATSKIPRTVRNQFGGSLGGPIIHNKTFFFFNFEDAELRSGSISRITVPTALERTGDFSDYTALSVLRDPLTGTSTSTQTPFPGKKIPTSRFDSVATKALDYFGYPTPNLSGLTSNYIYSLVAPQYLRQYTAKLDHMLTPKDTLSLRAWQGWTYARIYQAWNTKSANSMRDYLESNVQATWSRIVTPSIANELRFGWWNMPRDIMPENPGTSLFDTLGVTGVDITYPAGQNAGPRFNFGGTGATQAIGANPSFPQVFRTRSFNLTDGLNITRSRHSIKLGAQILWVQSPWSNTSTIRGQLNYTGNASAWWSTNHAFADFLIGIPYSSTLAKPDTKGPIDLREQNYAAYITDDWKISPTFTMTFGLRYEYVSPLTEANNQGLSSFDEYANAIVVNSPSLLSSWPSTIGYLDGLKIVTSRSLGLGNALQIPDKNNWAPRLGIAWRPFGGSNTVLRGGYGVYYADQCILWTGRMGTNQPWATSYNYSTSTNNSNLLSNTIPFPIGSRQAPTFTNFDRNFRTSYTQQWNATLEKTFFGSYAGRLSYIGNKGTKLRQPLNIDQPTSVAKVGSSIVYTYPHPELSGASTSYSLANASYNAMQLEFKKRWSHGFLLSGNWTWAKAIDTDHDDSTPMDSYHLNLDRGNSSYVSRHTVAIWGVYQLPFGRSRHFFPQANRLVDGVIGGWSLSGTSRYWTGQYLSLSANVGTRPDVVAGMDPFQNVPAGRWFNYSAYKDPYYDSDHPTLVFGNSARNSLPTPNQFQMDFSLSKSFTVREGHKVSIRAEAFNAPNHPNLGTPATNIDNTTNAGMITSAGQARYFQWSARYEF
jgi:hypothetical protein